MIYKITEYRDRPHSTTHLGRRQIYALTVDEDPRHPGPVHVLVKNGKPVSPKGALLLREMGNKNER